MMQESEERRESARPGTSGAPFLQGAWYAAGFSEALNAVQPLSRRLLSQPLVFFREAGGQAVAIGNRCPHRFAPLSMGQVIEGRIRCGYHGLTFDRTGKCVHNPHGPAGPLSVPAYPLIERDGLLWVWMGNPHASDEALIPDLPRCDEGEFHVRRGYLHGQAHYELMTDNILDLSHIEYLHPGLGTPAVSRAKVEVAQEGNLVRTTRRMVDEVLPPSLARVYRSGEQRVNRTMSVTWYPAANMSLQVTVQPVEQEQTWRTGSYTLHLFTPETERSTHYFYVALLSKQMVDSTTADAFMAAVTRAFTTEDKAMIEEQAKMIGAADILELRPSLLPIDKAPVLARRTLAKLIGAERAG